MLDDGTLAPGSKLPPECVLARQFGVSVATVRQAKLSLVGRGVVSCTRSRGSFVTPQASKPRVAIFWSTALGRGEVGTGLLMVLSELERVGAESMVFHNFDGSSISARIDMAKILRSFHPQIAIFTAILPTIEEFCRREGIPMVACGRRQPDIHCIHLDGGQMAQTGLEHLFAVGVRETAMIAPADAPFQHAWRAFHREHRLNLPPQWYIGWNAPSMIPCADRFGYESFLSLWQQRVRPKGLVVLDDVVFRGILMGMGRLGVLPSRDIDVVSHVNRDSHVFLPAHFARLEVDTAEYARQLQSLIEQVLKNPSGPARDVFVQARLIL